MGRDEPAGENNGSPYSRTAYIFEHGVWRRLERLGDTGIAKTAQNWILPVASRRFHSAHTRDRRRQPEASCFYVIDGYGVTGQSQIMENLEFPRHAAAFPKCHQCRARADANLDALHALRPVDGRFARTRPWCEE